MKNKRFLPDWSILFFLMTLVLALFSWMGSIYGMGEVQSLLSAEGVRWWLGHVVENYVRCPALGIMLILFMGLGIVVRSGLYGVLFRLFRREKLLSRKERRALRLALGACGIYFMLILLALLLPWNFLQGVTGAWLHSPLVEGMVYILSLGVGISGMVYGYVSDTFRRMEDVVSAMSWLISRSASYFVVLFFIVQFFSSLEYTRLPEWIGLSNGMMEVLYLFFCYIPLLHIRARINNKV